MYEWKKLIEFRDSEMKKEELFVLKQKVEYIIGWKVYGVL